MDEVNPVLSPQEPAHTRIPIKILVILLVVIAIAIFFSLVLFGTYSDTGQLVGTTPMSTGVSQQPVEGLLVFSLVAPSPSPTQFNGVFPFIYDLVRSELTYVFADQLDGEKKAFTEQYRLSPNSDWAVFIGQGLLENSTTTLRIPQIYRADITGIKNFTTLVATLRAGKVVSDDTNAKRAPVISDTGDVLYMSTPPETPFSNSPNSWVITYVPLQGTRQMLVNGTYPQWVDANRFIFLKSDGLYLYSIDTGYSQKLWGTQGAVSSNSMMDLSDDRTTIAWSTPEDGSVALLRVLDWEGPTITLRGAVSVHGLWPVISPDSSALAVLTSDPVPGSDVGLRVALYSVDTRESILPSISLLDSDPTRTALTDWRP